MPRVLDNSVFASFKISKYYNSTVFEGASTHSRRPVDYVWTCGHTLRSKLEGPSLSWKLEIRSEVSSLIHSSSPGKGGQMLSFCYNVPYFCPWLATGTPALFPHIAFRQVLRSSSRWSKDVWAVGHMTIASEGPCPGTSVGEREKLF